MKKLITITALSSLIFAQSGEEIFKAKCATCHTSQNPATLDQKSLIAPNINNALSHVKRNFNTKEKAVNFMVDYILNPNPSKSVCPSIDRFGPMPSQKGIVTKDEAIKVSNYLYDNFPIKSFKDDIPRANGLLGGIKAKFIFNKIDANDDGFITIDELNKLRAKKSGLSPNAFKYRYFFDNLDKNRDGKWSYEEFKAFIK